MDNRLGAKPNRTMAAKSATREEEGGKESLCREVD